MKVLKILLSLLTVLFALAVAPCARANNAGAVVLVNSQSSNYFDFTRFIQPYLGNFGVPYTVLDIASNPVDSSLTNYALIIVGHSQLDTNGTYLTADAQSSISLAVSSGVGLVSFDNLLSTNTVPLYQFEQDIFGLTYTNSFQGWTVEFPPTEPDSQMHYITALHVTNDLITLSNANGTAPMPVSGFSLPANDTAVVTSAGAPLVVITKYGQGRAVQWSSYAWMSTAIQGPINGMDDLVWRGFVWAARKPFVMRGMPHIATMRIDDVTGNEATTGTEPTAFWWVHQMTNAGFKPWLSLFTDDIHYESMYFPGDGRVTDLSNLVASGSVTASMHSFSANQTTEPNFFYFDHLNLTNYSDDVMSNNFVLGSQFLQWAGITSSKVIIAHFSEVGTNAFDGLTNWGIQFFMEELVPGTLAYETPYGLWLKAAPYRLYDTPQLGESDLPFFYADWLTVPNHPELNNKFFDCYTGILNVGPAAEWAPSESDLQGSITRGYQMLKRGFDSMIMGNIFTHEFYIDPSDGPAYGTFNTNTNDFMTVLQGITNKLASYQPIFMTLDDACQYVRATRTSQLTNADFDPATGQVTADFSGYTDIPITSYYYTGEDSAITNNPATVPMFSGGTNVTLATLAIQPPPLTILSITGAGTPNVVITWSAISNVTYRVRYISDFVNGTWNSLTPDVTATNNTASATDNPGDDVTQRFYQVIVP